MFAPAKACALWIAAPGSPGDFMGCDFKTHLPIRRPWQVGALLQFGIGEVMGCKATGWGEAVDQ